MIGEANEGVGGEHVEVGRLPVIAGVAAAPEQLGLVVVRGKEAVPRSVLDRSEQHVEPPRRFPGEPEAMALVELGQDRGSSDGLRSDRQGALLLQALHAAGDGVLDRAGVPDGRARAGTPGDCAPTG
jgi:hypothetical protein